MYIDGLKCPGCGSSNVNFDNENRKLICMQCGGEHYYSRATLNSNSKVVLNRENAIKFFEASKYEDARLFARDILNIFKDNAPARYIIAYYSEFIEKRENSLKEFFYETEKVALEYDEVEELKKLIISSAINLTDFENEIIRLIAKNMQSIDDADKLRDFIDLICPYFTQKRVNINFLNNELIENYKELTAHCIIPKTCLSLLKSIEKNPDSPYFDNSFYLDSKTRYFFENYVIPIGDIIDSMGNNDLKTKFKSVYLTKKEQYVLDAGIK